MFCFIIAFAVTMNQSHHGTSFDLYIDNCSLRLLHFVALGGYGSSRGEPSETAPWHHVQGSTPR